MPGVLFLASVLLWWCWSCSALIVPIGEQRRIVVPASITGTVSANVNRGRTTVISGCNALSGRETRAAQIHSAKSIVLRPACEQQTHPRIRARCSARLPT
jgi:hypothetical protein